MATLTCSDRGLYTVRIRKYLALLAALLVLYGKLDLLSRSTVLLALLPAIRSCNSQDTYHEDSSKPLKVKVRVTIGSLQA